MRRPAFPALLVLLASTGLVAGSPAGAEALPEAVADEDVPRAVAALLDEACYVQPGSVTRRPFDRGVLFAGRCPSNNQNYMQAFVRASGADGAGAEMPALPPGPDDGGEPLLVLSDVRVFPETRTVAQILVDTERAPAAPCRMESLWRLDDPEPRLVFYRRSVSCEDGREMRWDVVMDERTPAEGRERW